MSRQKVYGACPHDCPDTCGIVTEVENGKAVTFYGEPDHKITQGWLCTKVRPYLEHVYHKERLMTPLRRTNSKAERGTWTPISWEAAIDEITSRWKSIGEEYGYEAILPHSYSGTLGVVQLDVAGGRFWNRLGASQLERSVCCAAHHAAVRFTMGNRHSPSYPDIIHSKLIILWGHNPVSTAPHFMPFLVQAKRNGSKVIVIDPRRTRSAKQADIHIAPLPGTDGALALGIAHILQRDGHLDHPFLKQHTVGWETYLNSLDQYSPERVSEITDLQIEEIEQLAHLYGSIRPGVIKFSDGLQRHQNGGQTSRAIQVLPALTGQYGKLGGGLIYSTGGYLPLDRDTITKASASPHPPTRIVNMNRLGAALSGEVQDPPIMSLFVFASNPATSNPHAGLIRKGLQREDLFTIVHELYMTDTADYADIVLPATSQLEHLDLNTAYGHHHLTLNDKAIDPLGECVSNWDLMRMLAQGMGFEEPYLHEPTEKIIDDILETSSRRIPALDGVTLKTLRDNKGALHLEFDPPVPYADLSFATPSGKIEIYSQQMADLGMDPIPTYRPQFDRAGLNGHHHPDEFKPELALNLVSGAGHHFISSTFGNLEAHREHSGTPFVEIHPLDAEIRGIVHDQTVVIKNGRGEIKVRAVVTENVRRGVVISPKGYWANKTGGKNINWLIPDDLADLGNQATFHSCRVWVDGMTE